jgi:hypothetical protein
MKEPDIWGFGVLKGEATVLEDSLRLRKPPLRQVR